MRTQSTGRACFENIVSLSSRVIQKGNETSTYSEDDATPDVLYEVREEGHGELLEKYRSK
jgi:hypothetical protein